MSVRDTGPSARALAAAPMVRFHTPSFFSYFSPDCVANPRASSARRDTGHARGAVTAARAGVGGSAGVAGMPSGAESKTPSGVTSSADARRRRFGARDDVDAKRDDEARRLPGAAAGACGALRARRGTLRGR